MKTALILTFTLVSHLCLSQNTDKAEKILGVYEKTLIPYFKEMPKNEYPDPGYEEVIASRVLVLRAEAYTISGKLLEKLKEGKINTSDQELFMRVADSEFRNQFPGLKKAFFDNTHAEVRKMKL